VIAVYLAQEERALGQQRAVGVGGGVDEFVHDDHCRLSGIQHVRIGFPQRADGHLR
jgi:hypothetical protein